VADVLDMIADTLPHAEAVEEDSALRIAIVGRPNVGKSALFNRMVGRRQALVEDLAGTTRDRIYGDVSWRHETFRLVDTGGLEAKAEEGYRVASRWGRNPQPGLALLRLAQGQVEAAAAAARLMLDETRDPAERAMALPALVEIMLAAGDVQSARAGADELAVMAEALEAPLLSAVSGYANGAVLLREGEARAALSELRRAFAGWQAIEAPYEAARARVLVGLACRALGDHDTEEMEFDAARWLFQELGAASDLARVEALSPRPASKTAAGLTGRELEVLRLVASGKTNHAIAADLFISDHTVRRHLQNIFVKLGVSSRAAATAFAFQHDLT